MPTAEAAPPRTLECAGPGDIEDYGSLQPSCSKPRPSRVVSMRCHLAAALCLLLAAGAPAAAQLAAPGPSGYADETADFGIPAKQNLHLGSPHAPTPLAVPGAKTITTVELYQQLSAHHPMLLLYVNEGGDTIAGSHWLFGAGRGASFTDGIQARLNNKTRELTHGNNDARIVVFCYDAHCWLSYNAALRLVKLGYRDVYWYRGGKMAWQAAGLPLVAVPQDDW